MQENKPVLELKNTKEKVYQKLKWKKNICHCALVGMFRSVSSLSSLLAVCDAAADEAKSPISSRYKCMSALKY